MTTREDDMSTFVLDVYWASGRRGDPAVEAHVARCERCRAYLAHLDEGAAATSVPRPNGARAVGVASRRRRWVLPAGGAFALAAGVLLWARTRSAVPEDYVGIKGTPAVQLLVHRGADTRPWDGLAPVRPGDALALRVDCEGLSRIAVAGRGRDGWQLLSSVECPREGAPLPFTLVVDDQPGDETLAVVLSREPIEAAHLPIAIEEARRASDLWVVTFRLPKDAESNR